MELPVEHFSVWLYLKKLSPFLKILEHAVPFATGNQFRKCKPDFMVECLERRVLNKIVNVKTAKLNFLS